MRHATPILAQWPSRQASRCLLRLDGERLLLAPALAPDAMRKITIGRCILPGRMQGAHLVQQDWRLLRLEYALGNMINLNL